MYLSVCLRNIQLMSKKRKNKNKNKYKSQNFYLSQTKNPEQINKIALEIFGSLYYNPRQDSI